MLLHKAKSNLSVFGRDDASFLERLLQSKDLKMKKNFQAPKQRNGTFIVNHYADSVSYHVEEFCEKNKDLLVSDVVTMMQVQVSTSFTLYVALSSLTSYTDVTTYCVL